MKKGDFIKYGGKTWTVFAISDTGLVTLRNVGKGIPASLVVAPEQAKRLNILMKIIKH